MEAISGNQELGSSHLRHMSVRAAGNHLFKDPLKLQFSIWIVAPLAKLYPQKYLRYAS